MFHYVDLKPIISDHVHPFYFRRGRRFSWVRTVLTLVLPLMIALVLSLKHPVIAEKYQVTFLTVFGLLAGVMTALLPIVQSVVTISLPTERYPLRLQKKWDNQKVRLEVLRGLYSSICMSVIYLVGSFIPLFVLQFENFPGIVKQINSGLIYFVGVAVAICFLEVISGVYRVLDAHADEIDTELERIAPDGQTHEQTI